MERDFVPRRRNFHIYRKIVITVIVIAIITGGIYGGRELSWKTIEADEVAVIINNLTGGIKEIDRAGAVLYYPFIQDIYILDKRELVLELSAAQIDEKHPEGNPLMVKTIDGGDVILDLQIHYMIKPELAAHIALNTGVGNIYKEVYKQKWLHDYARTICYYNYGELKIDEFPDSVKRDEKAKKARKELNELLNPHGYVVTSVNLSDYRYYREYAEKIHERRLADKEVEEQQVRQEAARANQRKVIVEETKKLEVEVARFMGGLQKRIEEAEGRGAATREEADAYYIRVVNEADALYDKLAKEAKALLVELKAKANGLNELREALEGNGSRNLVRLEYAKRLKNAIIRGTPIRRLDTELPQTIERFKYIEDAPNIDYTMPEPPDSALITPLKQGDH